MAFNQWNKDVTANAAISLDVITPLVGTSSLNFTTSAASAALGGYVTPTNASGLVKGIEQGRLRSLMANDMNNHGMGFVVLGSADTLATVNGSFYRFEMFSTGPSASYGLGRSNGANTCVTTTLSTVFVGPITITQGMGSMYPFQFEFIVDTVNLGGVYLAISRGIIGSDFGTLATLVQYIDSSASKLTTSNSEGLYSRCAGTVLLDTRMDQTSLYTLT